MIVDIRPEPSRERNKDNKPHAKTYTNFSEHNLRKLSILRVIMTEYKSAEQIATETFVDGENMNEHKLIISRALSRYATHFTKPYVKSKKIKPQTNGCRLKYKCTVKGLRVVKRLIQKQRLGLPLNLKKS